jgi:hypothetical protein
MDNLIIFLILWFSTGFFVSCFIIYDSWKKYEPVRAKDAFTCLWLVALGFISIFILLSWLTQGCGNKIILERKIK